MKLSLKERVVLFAAFAFAMGVSMAHAWSIPIACLRIFAPHAFR